MVRQHSFSINPLWVQIPRRCISAASLKHTAPLLRGSRTPGLYPDWPPGWYAIPRSWKRLPVTELTRSAPLISRGRTASVLLAQSARTAVNRAYWSPSISWDVSQKEKSQLSHMDWRRSSVCRRGVVRQTYKHFWIGMMRAMEGFLLGHSNR